MLDRTNTRSGTDARIQAKITADKYIPTADGAVARSDNQPEAVAIAQARETGAQIGAFLQETPVIESLDQARAAATQIRLGNSALEQLEAERTSTPDYVQWRAFDARIKTTNKLYKAVRDPLTKLISEIDKRLFRYREREKERKRQEAADAQRRAEELQRRAQQAAFARDEAINDAQVGISEDVGQLIVEADQLEKRAALSGQVADGLMRNADTVRVRDEFGGRAVADRNPDVPVVADLIGAITVLGPTVKILEAVISSARDFRREHGHWPAGINTVKQRSLES